MTRRAKRWLWRVALGLSGLLMLLVIAGVLVVRSAWFYEKVIVDGKKPSDIGLEVWHEGRCGKCGRKLIVPESIARGIGPEKGGTCATGTPTARPIRRRGRMAAPSWGSNSIRKAVYFSRS